MQHWRGLWTLLTQETEGSQYSTALFVTSAERDILEIVLPRVSARFPGLSITMLAPESYTDLVRPYGEVCPKESFTSRPLAALAALRRRRFDVCILVWGGRPTFHKIKLAALFFNARRTFVYDEKGDVIPLDRSHLHAVIAHLLSRCRRLRRGALFFPFGFTYLLVRTAWLNTRARRNITASL